MRRVGYLNNALKHSIIKNGYNKEINYFDSFRIEIQNIQKYSVDYITGLFFSFDPFWIRWLFKLRNILVKPFGIQTGLLPTVNKINPLIKYKVGGRAVFFNVIDRNEDEIVMAENDKHLYFRTSTYVERNLNEDKGWVSITTFVHFNQLLGKIYFIPVKPFHKIIIKSMLRRMMNRLRE